MEQRTQMYLGIHGVPPDPASSHQVYTETPPEDSRVKMGIRMGRGVNE